MRTDVLNETFFVNKLDKGPFQGLFRSLGLPFSSL